jgi:hypothetical protein
MNTKLESIAAEAADNLKALVRENEDKLLEAWSSCEAEAHANESMPKFKLGLGVTLDLDGNKMTTDLSWCVRYKATAECAIPDPDQGKLPLDEKTTVTIKAESGNEVTVPMPVFRAAVADLKRQRRAKV